MKRHCPQCAIVLPADAHEARTYCSTRCKKRAERQRLKSREKGPERNEDYAFALREQLHAHVRNPTKQLLKQLEAELWEQEKFVLVENPPAGWIPDRTTYVAEQSDGSFLLQRWTDDFGPRPIQQVVVASGHIVENGPKVPINRFTGRPFGSLNKTETSKESPLIDLTQPNKAPKGGML